MMGSIDLGKKVKWRTRKGNEWTNYEMTLAELKKEFNINHEKYESVYEKFMKKFPNVTSEEHEEFVRLENVLNSRSVMLRIQIEKFFGSDELLECARSSGDLSDIGDGDNAWVLLVGKIGLLGNDERSW